MLLLDQNKESLVLFVELLEMVVGVVKPQVRFVWRALNPRGGSFLFWCYQTPSEVIFMEFESQVRLKVLMNWTSGEVYWLFWMSCVRTHWPRVLLKMYVDLLNSLRALTHVKKVFKRLCLKFSICFETYVRNVLERLCIQASEALWWCLVDWFLIFMCCGAY